MNCGLRILRSSIEDAVSNPQSAIRNPQSNMKPFILIIEDDPDIAESIRYNLERDGSFVAQVALTGEAGLNIALSKGQSKQTGQVGQTGQTGYTGQTGHLGRTGDLTSSAPDLIVLDLNLPG